MLYDLNITNVDEPVTELPLISDEATVIFSWAMYAVLCQAVDVFGIITNIINMACFTRQGFKEPVNISLLGLAISDLGCLLTLSWVNVCLTPAVLAANLPFDVMEVVYMTGSMPHLTFTKLSSWITAIITMERCLCIIAPLKVKSIVTPRRVSVIIVSTFIILIFTGLPIYFVDRLDVKFSAQRNRSIIGIVSSSDHLIVEQISYGINNVSMPFVAFTVITVCTVILVISLRRRTKWRKTTASQDDVNNRNMKVAKMVVMISTLFISSFVPLAIIMLVNTFQTSLTINGKHMNIGVVIFGIGVLGESINSSTNIFIYYHMSKKYRDALHGVLCKPVSKEYRNTVVGEKKWNFSRKVDAG